MTLLISVQCNADDAYGFEYIYSTLDCVKYNKPEELAELVDGMLYDRYSSKVYVNTLSNTYDYIDLSQKEFRASDGETYWCWVPCSVSFTNPDFPVKIPGLSFGMSYSEFLDSEFNRKCMSDYAYYSSENNYVSYCFLGNDYQICIVLDFLFYDDLLSRILYTIYYQ